MKELLFGYNDDKWSKNDGSLMSLEALTFVKKKLEKRF